MRVTGQLLECIASHQRVDGHAVSAVRGGFTTAPEHMPASHRAHLDWTPAKLIAWGQRIGVSTAAVVTWQLEHRPHPERGYRTCLSLLALVRRYSVMMRDSSSVRLTSSLPLGWFDGGSGSAQDRARVASCLHRVGLGAWRT